MGLMERYWARLKDDHGAKRRKTNKRFKAYIEIMKVLTVRQIPFFALFLSSGLLCGAWFFEYVLGYSPCTMCYWQRDAHKVVVGVSIAAIILMQMDKSRPGLYPDKTFGFIVGLALIGAMVVAFWHAGVEYKWWDGPQTCTAGAGPIIDYSEMTLEEINKLMNEAPLPACSDSPWPNSPISMAGVNGLICLIGALFCFRTALRGRNV